MAEKFVITAKVTSKGQITLPLPVRRRLGVRSGDRVRFETDGGDMRIRRESGPSPFARYQGIGTPGIGPGRAAILAWVRRMREP